MRRVMAPGDFRTLKRAQPGPGTSPTWTRDGQAPGPGTGRHLDQARAGTWTRHRSQPGPGPGTGPTWATGGPAGGANVAESQPVALPAADWGGGTGGAYRSLTTPSRTLPHYLESTARQCLICTWTACRSHTPCTPFGGRRMTGSANSLRWTLHWCIASRRECERERGVGRGGGGIGPDRRLADDGKRISCGGRCIIRRQSRKQILLLVGEGIRGSGRGLGIANYMEAGGLFLVLFGSQSWYQKHVPKKGSKMDPHKITPEQKKGRKSGVQKRVPKGVPF